MTSVRGWIDVTRARLKKRRLSGGHIHRCSNLNGVMMLIDP